MRSFCCPDFFGTESATFGTFGTNMDGLRPYQFVGPPAPHSPSVRICGFIHLSQNGADHGKTNIAVSFSNRHSELPWNPPAPKVLGRDLPDGTRKRLQVYLGGGPIFRPKPPVFDRSWRSPSKNTVKNSTEDTCSWTRPSKIGKRKVKKPRVFQLFDLNFLVCNIFFCGSAGGRARRRIFEFLDPFSDWFSSFCDSRNTGFYSVFSVFCMLDG